MNKRANRVSLLLLAAIALGGCSNDQIVAPPAGASSSPTPTPITIATEEDAIAAANETAQQFLRIWDDITLSESPTDISPLEEVARDAALDTVQNIEDRASDLGYTVIKGGTNWTLLDGQSFAASATFQGEEMPFGVVTLFGCADYSDTIGTNAAGEEVPPLGPWKNQLTLAYWPDEKRWYVTEFDTLQDQSEECAD